MTEPTPEYCTSCDCAACDSDESDCQLPFADLADDPQFESFNARQCVKLAQEIARLQDIIARQRELLAAVGVVIVPVIGELDPHRKIQFPDEPPRG